MGSTDFDGTIERELRASTPSWRRREAPQEAPNVVVILCDDLGFADIGPYGSEVETPNLWKIAEAGVRYVNYHVTPLCSPTRAALLTGVNHHAAGVGHLVREDHGFPGYRSELLQSVSTAAEVFRWNGYTTFAVGKWHLSPVSAQVEGGDRSSWPLQRGFDRYYGFLAGMTNSHQPHMLYEDNHVLKVQRYPDQYYLADAITDQAIEMISDLRAESRRKPFFLYLAHAAVHAPLHAKPDDIAKYRGWYDLGWDAIRERRYARQLELGVIERATKLAPRNPELPGDVCPWEDLTSLERELAARYMEVYAAMIDSVDQNAGRLQQMLANLDELDNTIFVFTSDNGASREGGPRGTTEYYRTNPPVSALFDETTEGCSYAERGSDIERDHGRLDLIGGPQVMAHFPAGWGMASNTPFRLYKGATFAGGQQVPLIVSWPKGLDERRAIRRQYAYVTDVLPTLVELIGLTVPEQRAGLPARPMTGSSLAPTIRDPQAPTSHEEQYYEMQGNRGFVRAGWEVLTFHRPGERFGGHEWQLYHIDRDASELEELSHIHPEKREELASAWDEAAWANEVYPLADPASGLYALEPPWLRREPRPLVLTPANHTLHPAVARGLIQGRSFNIRVDLEFRLGDAGVLVAHGDQGAGYLLYVEHDRLYFVRNSYGFMVVCDVGELAAATSSIELAIDLHEDGFWDAEISTDSNLRARVERLEPWSAYTPFEGIDVGIDRRSPVSWEIYEKHGPFPYSGVLIAVTYVPGPLTEDAAVRLEAESRAADQKYD